MDLFRTAEIRTRRIASAVVEFDDVIERRCLAIAEVRAGFRNMPETFRTPEADRNGL